LTGGAAALWLLVDDDEGRWATDAVPYQEQDGSFQAPQRPARRYGCWLGLASNRAVSTDLQHCRDLSRATDPAPDALDGAEDGKLYQVSVRYQCGTEPYCLRFLWPQDG
jgi:hypothetical protein